MKYLMMSMMLILTMCAGSDSSTLQGKLFPASMTYSFDPMPEIDVLTGDGLVQPQVAEGVRTALGIKAAKIVKGLPVGAKFQIKGVKFVVTQNNDYKVTVILVGNKEDLLFPIEKTISLQQLTHASAENPLELEYTRPDSDPDSSYDWEMSSNFKGSIYLESDTNQLHLVGGELDFTFSYQGFLSRGVEHYPAPEKFYELKLVDEKSYVASLDSDGSLNNVDSDLALTE